MADGRGTCFVTMGFGKKTDFEGGRTLDLDKSYRSMIKPAVEAAGLQCIRADEILHSGLIDVPMFEQLLEAEIVVADLSTSNKNALYGSGSGMRCDRPGRSSLQRMGCGLSHSMSTR